MTAVTGATRIDDVALSARAAGGLNRLNRYYLAPGAVGLSIPTGDDQWSRSQRRILARLKKVCEGKRYIVALEDLLQFTRADLLLVPGFGRRCLAEVEALLGVAGLHLGSPADARIAALEERVADLQRRLSAQDEIQRRGGE